jgi:tetratricopeptide (TPR) repeat protein
MKWILPLSLMAAPAFAQTCPPVTDHSQRAAEIVLALGEARGQGEAQILTQELWGIWTDAPDEVAQAMLDEGMSRRAGFDFLGARNVLDRLVEYCPDYAEGYNQRAFANYLSSNFGAALADLDRALEITPNHIAALSGKGLTLMGLGRNEEAQAALRAAVEMNPWLQERALLDEPMPTDL